MEALSDEKQELKRLAAERGVELVESGMVLGLGAGTTANFALELIAERLQSGQLKDIVGIPCSRRVAAAALKLGIPLTRLSESPEIDLTIDGADEVDPEYNLIKGGGAALLREKIVAQASRREVIVVDESKLSPTLGTRFPLPVEVFPFGWRPQSDCLTALGAKVKRRMEGDDSPFETDQGNYILDCEFGPIRDPKALAAILDGRAGVAGHGLFIGLATDVIVAGASGVRHLRTESS
jgi:ribose 5-phosphate isomerase A